MLVPNSHVWLVKWLVSGFTWTLKAKCSFSSILKAKLGLKKYNVGLTQNYESRINVALALTL